MRDVSGIIYRTIHPEKREERSFASIGFDGFPGGGGSAHGLGTPHTWCLWSSWAALKDAFFHF